MEGLEFNASPGLRAGDRGLFIYRRGDVQHTTHRWGGCVLIVCLLLLFPRRSVPAVLIEPVRRRGWWAFLHVHLDLAFISRRAREGCPVSVCLQVRLNVRAHRSAADIRPSFCLPLVSAAEGSRGMGSTAGAASILCVPREIRHEIKAPIKGQGRHCHLIQHYLYSREMVMMSPSQ